MKIKNNYIKLTALLLILSGNFTQNCVCQRAELYLVNVDSILQYSSLGEKKKSFEDSLSQLYSERLSKSVDTLIIDCIDFAENNRGCSGDGTERKGIVFKLEERQKWLIGQEEKIELFAPIIETGFHNYAKEAIVRLFKSDYKEKNSLIDSSNGILYKAEKITEERFLTDWFIYQINIKSNLDQDINQLERYISEKILNLMNKKTVPNNG